MVKKIIYNFWQKLIPYQYIKQSAKYVPSIHNMFFYR